MDEFTATTGAFAILERNFKFDEEQVASLRRKSAEFWGMIALILLDVKSEEKFERAIKECFEVLGRDKVEEPALSKLIRKNVKTKSLSEKISNEVFLKTEGTCNRFFVSMYLKKMYDSLDSSSQQLVNKELLETVCRILEDAGKYNS